MLLDLSGISDRLVGARRAGEGQALPTDSGFGRLGVFSEPAMHVFVAGPVSHTCHAMGARRDPRDKSLDSEKPTEALP